MVSWVTGSFRTFNATLQTERQDVITADVNFTAEGSSISINNEQRDAHFRSGDFFDAENHPRMFFQSSGLKRIGENEYEGAGTLNVAAHFGPVQEFLKGIFNRILNFFIKPVNCRHMSVCQKIFHSLTV